MMETGDDQESGHTWRTRGGEGRVRMSGGRPPARGQSWKDVGEEMTTVGELMYLVLYLD